MGQVFEFIELSRSLSQLGPKITRFPNKIVGAGSNPVLLCEFPIRKSKKLHTCKNLKPDFLMLFPITLHRLNKR